VSIEEYSLDINGIKCKVFDTPGLSDDLDPSGNDDKYIAEMKTKALSIHCLLYIVPLLDNRISHDRRTINRISKGYGHEVWKHAIIVFTFSNNAKNINEYKNAITVRSRLFSKELAPYTKGVFDVPCIAIDNEFIQTLDGVVWRDKLVIEVFNRIQTNGFTQFFFATLDSVTWEVNEDFFLDSTNFNPAPIYSRNDSERVVHIMPNQAREIKRRVMEEPEIMTPFIEIGKALGAILGGATGLSSVIGGAIGSLLGLVLWIIGVKKSKPK
jgi:hypothetical protein